MLWGGGEDGRSPEIGRGQHGHFLGLRAAGVENEQLFALRWVDDEKVAEAGAAIARMTVKEHHLLDCAADTETKQLVEISQPSYDEDPAVGPDGDMFNEAIHLQQLPELVADGLGEGCLVVTGGAGRPLARIGQGALGAGG